MSQINKNSTTQKIGVKVQGDTDERLAKFQNMRRSNAKVKVESTSQKAEKKDFSGDAQGPGFSGMGIGGSIGIVLVLGFTLAAINDFSDLVLWQKMFLISQTIDITTLILVLFMVMFGSRAYFASIFIVLFVFLLEILPVMGVLPLWTIGMAVWYLMNRKKD